MSRFFLRGRLRGPLNRLALALLPLSAYTPALVAQGWIEPLPSRPIPLGSWAVEKTRTEVRVTVEGRVAHVELSEWFRNGAPHLAEGEYLYPLPGEAAFSDFSLWQGEEELDGVTMDREQARAIYEEMIRRHADPALIELVGHGLLRARVFPMEPGEELKVQLRYTQLLEMSGDALHFRYAGGVRTSGTRPPRSRTGRGDPQQDQSSQGQDRDDRAVRTSFELVAADGEAYLDPFSPTHALVHRRRSGRLVVHLDGDELPGELSVFLPLARPGVGLTLVTHRPVGEDGYLMLTLSPGRVDAEAEPRDMTVAVDVSGSMAGVKIAQAREALHGLLESLKPADRFRLVSFSSGVRVLGEGWWVADAARLDEASTWVDALAADGATNIAAALEEAFRVVPGEGRLPVVIFITDGLPTVGEQNPERIADTAERARARARVFAFGLGTDVNTYLLDRLSSATRGSTDYVQPGESVERALSLLAAKIRHPVLTDVRLAGAPAELHEVYPVTLPDVFAGQELVLLGRYQGEGEGELVLTGRHAGRTERFAVEGSFPLRNDVNGYLPRLWASRKLGHLTRQVWLEGPTTSLIGEIKKIALRYGLPSEYTAYLVSKAEVAVAVGEGSRPGGLRLNMIAPPASAAEAQGVRAVASAVRARRLRDVSRAPDVDAAEDELASGLGLDGADHRVVYGRLFERIDGVWIDTTPATSDRAPVITVKLFSRAWFDVVDSLPEVAVINRELGRVEVAGARVRLRLDKTGHERLSHDRLTGLIADFRGAE